MIILEKYGRMMLINVVPRIASILRVSLPPLPSTCAIIEKNKKLLAIDLSYKKGLNLPGGGMQFNETIEEALKREIKEETNLEVKSMKYIGSEKYVHGKISQVSTCFKVEIKDFKKLKSSEEGEALWVTPRNLYENAAYKDVKKHLKKYYRFK